MNQEAILDVTLEPTANTTYCVNVERSHDGLVKLLDNNDEPFTPITFKEEDIYDRIKVSDLAFSLRCRHHHGQGEEAQSGRSSSNTRQSTSGRPSSNNRCYRQTECFKKWVTHLRTGFESDKPKVLLDYSKT